MSNNGPTITVSMSCAGCDHVRTEPYVIQDDRGVNVRCAHPFIDATKGLIGDTNWTTPAWCPERKKVYLEFVNDLTRWKDAT